MQRRSLLTGGSLLLAHATTRSIFPQTPPPPPPATQLPQLSQAVVDYAVASTTALAQAAQAGNAKQSEVEQAIGSLTVAFAYMQEVGYTAALQKQLISQSDNILYGDFQTGTCQSTSKNIWR